MASGNTAPARQGQSLGWQKGARPPNGGISRRRWPRGRWITQATRTARRLPSPRAAASIRSSREAWRGPNSRPTCGMCQPRRRTINSLQQRRVFTRTEGQRLGHLGKHHQHGVAVRREGHGIHRRQPETFRVRPPEPGRDARPAAKPLTGRGAKRSDWRKRCQVLHVALTPLTWSLLMSRIPPTANRIPLCDLPRYFARRPARTDLC